MTRRWLLVCAALLWAPAASRAQDAREAEFAALRSDLGDLLRTPGWRDARWGALVVSLDTGDTLFAQLADSALAPASNLKLLTSAAALEILGPEYRFRTYLVSDGTVRDGVLHGDLVIYGTGDPGISARFFPSRTTVLDALADQLWEAGVRSVDGDLVGDESYFPGPKWPDGWDPLDLNDHFAAAVSALSYNENVVSVRVQPGPAAGARPVIGTIPDHSGMEFTNYGVTVDGRARRRIIIIRDHPTDPVRVQGEISASGRDVYRQLTVPEPARLVVGSVRAALERKGIEVTGGDRLVSTPSASVVTSSTVWAPTHTDRSRPHVLARHVSPPLGAYLEVINKESNNHFAEATFRTLGRVTSGVASPQASARAVRGALEAMGVPTAGLTQHDGSGLSSLDRVSPATFVATLEHMARSSLWPQYWHSLAEVGVGRDLRRMLRTAADGNLRAKTGTIAGVSALSGVVRSADGERLLFSLLLNGARSEGFAKRTENLVGVRLASFSRSEARAVSAATASGSEEGGR